MLHVSQSPPHNDRLGHVYRPTALRPDASDPDRFSLQRVVDLFFRPSRFFSDAFVWGDTLFRYVAIWCFGVAHLIGQIDRAALGAEMGRPKVGWESLREIVSDSWGLYWLVLAAVGGVFGFSYAYVGGWWYRVRLKWAGDPEPDSESARTVWIYASFVMSLPVVMVSLVVTAVYPSFSAAWAAGSPWKTVLLMLPFWSVVTGYYGAIHGFEPSSAGARRWFLYLPLAYYGLALVVLLGGR